MKNSVVFPFEFRAEFGCFLCKHYLDFIRALCRQLQYYLDNDYSPSRRYTKAELAAYQEVVDFGHEPTAEAFIRVKAEAREAGTPFGSNAKVVAYLKANKLWGPKQ